jgi:hypothetical protein
VQHFLKIDCLTFIPTNNLLLPNRKMINVATLEGL